MDISYLKESINDIYNNNKFDKYNNDIKDIVEKSLSLIDNGDIRICVYQQESESYIIEEWVKKAILLSFRLYDNKIIETNQNIYPKFYDKIPLKFDSFNKSDFAEKKIRAVPGAIVRYGSYIGQNTILMPSFVNIGAYIDSGTMVDTWATIGSCAQIGKNCHISGGVGIGGVLEPLQANPVIIEDNVFIGARSEVAEGVIIGKGSVISMGVYIGKSTKIIDRETGEIYYGKIPPYSVVVPGNINDSKNKNISLYAAIIVKKVDDKTRSKTSINDLLRL